MNIKFHRFTAAPFGSNALALDEAGLHPNKTAVVRDDKAFSDAVPVWFKHPTLAVKSCCRSLPGRIFDCEERR